MKRMSKGSHLDIAVEKDVLHIRIGRDALIKAFRGSEYADYGSGVPNIPDKDKFLEDLLFAIRDDEQEDGTNRVHQMFDSAFNYMVDENPSEALVYREDR